MLNFHAGMIYSRLGQDGPARQHLEAALKINPHFSLLQVAEAKDALA